MLCCLINLTHFRAVRARSGRAGLSPSGRGPDSGGHLGGGDESGPLASNVRLAVTFIIEFARLTKGLHTTRVDSLGRLSSG
jgi:hypothetical protein